MKAVAGDALGKKISEALDSANVILVVVSQASIELKWLLFELNKVTVRMVKGECRVIPIVVEKVRLPPEVGGLLYADFTSSFEDGFQSVLTALQHEANRKAKEQGFWLKSGACAHNGFWRKGLLFGMERV